MEGFSQTKGKLDGFSVEYPGVIFGHWTLHNGRIGGMESLHLSNEPSGKWCVGGVYSLPGVCHAMNKMVGTEPHSARKVFKAGGSSPFCHQPSASLIPFVIVVAELLDNFMNLETFVQGMPVHCLGSSLWSGAASSTESASSSLIPQPACRAVFTGTGLGHNTILRRRLHILYGDGESKLPLVWAANVVLFSACLLIITASVK